MPELQIDLCGHSTTIACAVEDEPRLRQLIALVGERADAARGIVGDNDRWRQLLFTAIFLADELDSAGSALAAAGPASAPATLSSADNAQDLAADADRIMALTQRIGAALDRIDQYAASGLEPPRANA